MAGTIYRYADIVASNVELERDDTAWGENPWEQFDEIRDQAYHLIASTLVNKASFDKYCEAISKPTEQEADDEAFDEFNRRVAYKVDSIKSRLASVMTEV